jgi:hypothetical protein
VYIKHRCSKNAKTVEDSGVNTHIQEKSADFVHVTATATAEQGSNRSEHTIDK